MRSILVLLVLPALLLSACGGGSSSDPAGSSSSSSSSTSTSSSSTSSSSSSSSDSSSSSSSSTSTASNVVPITVDQGPSGLGNTYELNFPYVTVTVCAPGTTRCQTIDHVQVDTGSAGLRIISSVLQQSTLNLPAVNIGSAPLQECLEFADGYVWGPVVTADIQVGDQTASGVPVQIMGGSAYAVPNDCDRDSYGAEEDTVSAFGANAILGVGSYAQDCGDNCAQIVEPDSYYTCSTTCTGVKVPLAQQVANPVIYFAQDNNGVVLTMPSVPATGAATASGSLIFGIGTRSNNTYGSTATVLLADSYLDTISIAYNGKSYVDSYIDSGSNANYLNDNSIPTCGSSTLAPGFFCPVSTVTGTAVLMGTDGNQSTVTFSVANANTLVSGTQILTAFNNIAAPAGDAGTSSFDFGLPFFYGRTVYFAIEQRDAQGVTGPYYAY